MPELGNVYFAEKAWTMPAPYNLNSLWQIDFANQKLNMITMGTNPNPNPSPNPLTLTLPLTGTRTCFLKP